MAVIVDADSSANSVKIYVRHRVEHAGSQEAKVHQDGVSYFIFHNGARFSEVSSTSIPSTIDAWPGSKLGMKSQGHASSYRC